jgi:hypothetical protein
MRLKLDLIAADAGSMDPGPYYLGKNQSYMEKRNLKRDFRIMLKGALEQNCPLLLGSCGLAGDTGNLKFMLDVAEEVFAELGVRDLKVALIDSHVHDDVLLGHIHELKPLGHMPELTEKDIRACRKVAQMGIAPYSKALDEGARVVFAGRACDVAIFASDPIRRGIDPGLAYHAGHILECGAIACDPGSGSDCLLAEFRDDNSVVFTPLNKQRKATTYSIAAHSLYEEDHPTLQFYPEGILSFQKTEFFTAGERSAGIRNSVFIHRPLSIKIEGSKKIGERIVSILFVRDIDGIPASSIVYGRNGVEKRPVDEGEHELGIWIKVTSDNEEAAKGMLTLLKGLFMHFGYPGRRATAGNLAFPLSPSEITFQDEQGGYVSTVIAGTRDPFFQKSFEYIKSEIMGIVEKDYTDLSRECEIEILLGTALEPVLFLETIGDTIEEATAKHREEINRVERCIDPDRPSMRELYAGEAFVWGMFHLFSNKERIENMLFPISIYNYNGNRRELINEPRAKYQAIGLSEWPLELDPEKANLIEKSDCHGTPVFRKRLLEMANIIRSKDAGINKITFDVFFVTPQEYEAALKSNVFHKDNVANVLCIPLDHVIGTYRADDCYAVKVSTNRPSISGNPGERDMFGAQQHSKLLMLDIPVFMEELSPIQETLVTG